MIIRIHSTHSMQVQSTPQQLGFIVGRTIKHMPVEDLLATHGPSVYEAAGVDSDRVRVEYLLLLTSAAMHEIESAGLHVDTEHAVAQGLYDWMRQLPGGVGVALVNAIETATDAYAKAAEDDLHMENAPGGFSQLELEELEFFDHHGTWSGCGSTRQGVHADRGSTAQGTVGGASGWYARELAPLRPGQ